MEDHRIRAIAFYLPQFYPTPENDDWWTPGFTEWTNVARAKPLFKNHYQPRIPGELSFYDLRLPSVRERQAQLAREAGIEGFCYWHYWFGNGRRLLSEIFREVVETGKPDFPFCLCWANHSWYQKTWDPTKSDKLLMEQTYPGIEDYENHFYEMLPAFKDDRYIKVNDKLLFGIFDSDSIPNVKEFFATWNKLAEKNNLNGFYFFALAQGKRRALNIIELGYDAIVYDAYKDVVLKNINGFVNKTFKRLWRRVCTLPIIVDYSEYVNESLEGFKENPSWVPCIDPDFDHTPRSGSRTAMLHNSTPQKWGQLLSSTCKHIKKSNSESSLLFIKSWNEWGEGNYLEPDMKFGRAYLDETAKHLG